MYTLSTRTLPTRPPRANTTSVYVVVPPPRRRDSAILLVTDNKVTLFCLCACRACPAPSERDPEKGLWDEGGLGTLVMSPSRYQPLASFPLAACYLTLLKCHGKLDDVAIRIRPLFPSTPRAPLLPSRDTCWARTHIDDGTEMIVQGTDCYSGRL